MEIPLTSKIIFYADIIVFGIFCLIVWLWQLDILRGGSRENPDGSVDDWRVQKIHYGMALADITLAVPVAMVGIILIFTEQTLGYYLTGLAAFWYLWANLMTTATSLRFEKPKVTAMWILVFPAQALIALIYIIWSIVYFDAIFKSAST